MKSCLWNNYFTLFYLVLMHGFGLWACSPFRYFNGIINAYNLIAYIELFVFFVVHCKCWLKPSQNSRISTVNRGLTRSHFRITRFNSLYSFILNNIRFWFSCNSCAFIFLHLFRKKKLFNLQLPFYVFQHCHIFV